MTSKNWGSFFRYKHLHLILLIWSEYH